MRLSFSVPPHNLSVTFFHSNSLGQLINHWLRVSILSFLAPHTFSLSPSCVLSLSFSLFLSHSFFLSLTHSFPLSLSFISLFPPLSLSYTHTRIRSAFLQNDARVRFSVEQLNSMILLTDIASRTFILIVRTFSRFSLRWKMVKKLLLYGEGRPRSNLVNTHYRAWK